MRRLGGWRERMDATQEKCPIMTQKRRFAGHSGLVVSNVNDHLYVEWLRTQKTLHKRPLTKFNTITLMANFRNVCTGNCVQLYWPWVNLISSYPHMAKYSECASLSIRLHWRWMARARRHILRVECDGSVNLQCGIVHVHSTNHFRGMFDETRVANGFVEWVFCVCVVCPLLCASRSSSVKWIVNCIFSNGRKSMQMAYAVEMIFDCQMCILWLRVYYTISRSSWSNHTRQIRRAWYL